MRFGLRTKIMTFAAVALVTLVFATLWVVNRSITRHVEQGIHEDLRRASAVLENLLATREHALAASGQIIVTDPKFFSALTLPGSYRDPQVLATVIGVARDFNAITQVDLFEVMDAEGNVVGSAGHDASVATGRETLVNEALDGRQVSGILVQPQSHYQASVTPVFAGGRLVGALLLGSRIGGDLAERLRQLTRSEVTFVSQGLATASTLESAGERDAVLAAVRSLERRAAADPRGGTLVEVRGGSHLYLTLIGPLAQPDARLRQYFVMQRALDAEMAFLRSTQSELLGLGAIAVLVALLVSFMIAERITKPVQRLVRGAQEMERGNYEYPLAVTSGDEIGELAARFDDMRRRQREYVHSLQEVARVKSEFLSVASHELRTPISVIRGFHELMLEEKLGAVTPQQRQALEASDKSIGTLLRIAEDATRMAQIDRNHYQLKRSEVAVQGLVEEAVTTSTGQAAGRRVAVEIDVAAELGSAELDGPSMVQALAHLVSNGIRFTPDGGQVAVRAWREGAWLAIAVRDTGVGIDAERQKHLLERAFNVSNSLNHHSSSSLEFNSAGLGLGLPIALGIVEAHGGRLALESAPGAGTTFTMWIPIATASIMENAA